MAKKAKYPLFKHRNGKGEVWLDLPRGKTGAPRRFPLWPETRDAIAAYLPNRPSPTGDANKNRLFLTRYGQGWGRGDSQERTDAITGAFVRAREAAAVGRQWAFYDLRRTFQTIAAQTRDFPAVSFVMGHTPGKNDMAAIYNQHIDDDRLRAVVEHVRKWLHDDQTCHSARAS
jgi:integrase